MRNQIIKDEIKCNKLMFGKRINRERAQFHNSRRSLLDLSYTSLKYFGLFRIGDCVPDPEIREVCRLENKINMDYEFFDKSATPIYCGVAD